MSGDRLDALFAAARQDAPSSQARDEVWGRVAAAVAPVVATPSGSGGDPGAEALRENVAEKVAGKVAAGGAKVTAGAAATKLVALGALAGAAAAAVTLLLAGAGSAGSDRPIARPSRTPAIVVQGPTAGARLADPAPRPRAQLTTAASTPGGAGAGAEAAAVAIPRARDRDRERDQASSLAEEARLVTEARTALVRGEPARALTLARSTAALPTRALEPEELALEARALRALGRPDEAAAVEASLRQRFPGHALAR